MKLAEALMQRANLQKRIEELRTRLMANAKVQEGDGPSEPPATLLEELNEVVYNITQLVKRINRTNSATTLDENESGTIADAIATRDSLKLQHGIYRDLVNAAAVRYERFSKSEIRFVSAVDIAAVQRTADNIALQFRMLDAKLQAKNWEVDVLD